MDIVLINAPVTKVSPHSKLALPLGLAYIASFLQGEGRSVRVNWKNRAKLLSLTESPFIKSCT